MSEASPLQAKAPGIFISYSHKDEKLKKALEAHLKAKLGESIPIWSDHKIFPGQEWKAEIKGHLASARIILLLVSMDFLNSAFIRSQ